MITKKLVNKMCKLLSLIIILLVCINIVFSLNYESYDSFKVKKIVGYANSFNKLVEQQNKEFDIDDGNVLKSVFGVFTEGTLENVLEYDYGGRIGVMGLIPFLDDGTPYYYSQCLESDCMSVTVSDDSSVEEKREQVKQDYINIENSLCCAAYLLKMNKEQSLDELVFAGSNDKCSNFRDKAIYSDWEAAVRKFVGEGCKTGYTQTERYVYFVEKYSQMYQAFNKYTNFKSYGILEFTPSFSIKAPVLINIYDDIRSLVSDIMKDCDSFLNTEQCVEAKKTNFVNNHESMSFIYCEEPEVNVINSIYDRLTNAVLSDEDNCKYLIASQDLSLPPGESTFINITSNAQDDNVRIYNSNKEYSFSSDDERFNGDRFFKIEGFDGYTSYMFKDRFTQNLFFGDLRNIYLLKNSSLPSDSPLFIFEDQTGDFYKMTRQKIDGSSYPTCQKKYKYFTCLDTRKSQEVFDWTSWSWKKSADTIKIKFAFAINKNS